MALKALLLRRKRWQDAVHSTAWPEICLRMKVQGMGVSLKTRQLKADRTINYNE